MLVDAEDVDPGEATGVIRQLLQQRLDRLPDGVPVHPEPAGDRGDRAVVPLDTADRPPRRPHGELGPRRSQMVIFANAVDRTGRMAIMAAAIWLAHRHERRAVKQPIQKTPTPAART